VLIQLLFQVKYIDFEDRPKLFYKNLWECENFSDRRLIKEFFLPRIRKKRTLDNFLRKLRTTGGDAVTALLVESSAGFMMESPVD